MPSFLILETVLAKIIRIQRAEGEDEDAAADAAAEGNGTPVGLYVGDIIETLDESVYPDEPGYLPQGMTPEPQPHVEPMLVVSTAHVREATAKLLEAHCRRETRATDPWAKHPALLATVFAKGDVGWFIHVPTTVPDALGWGLPPDLHECMVYARARGCDWLCLDNAAPVVEGLTEYDW